MLTTGARRPRVTEQSRKKSGDGGIGGDTFHAIEYGSAINEKCCSIRREEEGEVRWGGWCGRIGGGGTMRHCNVNTRGREAQKRFFPAWIVLKVCSKKYIKNYPFFGIIYSIIITAQTLPCFFQLVAILSHFWPFFSPRRLIDVHNIFKMFNSCDYFISF